MGDAARKEFCPVPCSADSLNWKSCEIANDGFFCPYSFRFFTDTGLEPPEHIKPYINGQRDPYRGLPD